ncbi:MAG TPA: hypothetical protein VE868_05090 [Balneolaceae bacterium]|nr:hypothetical protein [Balneolaceae bacterium]
MKRDEFLKLGATGLASGLIPRSFQQNSKNSPKVIRVSKTTPTLQVVVNPKLRRGSNIHDQAFKALRDLGCDYVRYVPWLPYPKLAVAELKPPHNGKTSWDFSLIDPMTIDFLEATKGHSVMLNFSTIPEWMFKTKKKVSYPKDPNKVDWNYEQGTKFKDPTMKQVANYYKRLFSWYTQGGFTDEYGNYHKSGYHYSIPYWEVLNEVDFEHNMSPKTYTRLYDEVVLALKEISPSTKFAGMALAKPGRSPDFFEYFLNHDNHKPGVPLDFITYHFYAGAGKNEPKETWQYSFFRQADKFLDIVRYVEDIRKRLSPHTKTDIDEIGSINRYRPLPNFYWNLSGALYAYIFGNLSHIGIDVAGESQLVGYPTQFPSVSMLNWKTGAPNARYLVLKLIHKHFGPGDQIIQSNIHHANVYAYSVIGKDGKRRAMLVNKKNKSATVSLPVRGKSMEIVDQRNNKINSQKLQGKKVTLNGFAVAVVMFS